MNKQETHTKPTLRERIMHDPFFRLSVTANAVLLWNLLYAVFNGILGVYYRSYWFLSMAAWNLILGILRVYVFRSHGDIRRLTKTAGKGICFLAVVLSGIICMGIAEQHNPVRELTVMIALAAYTFISLTSCIINSIKAHRKKDEKLLILRNISLVSSLGALLSLERGMLGTFGDAASRFTLVMEAGTGAAVFALILLIGISLIYRKTDTPEAV